MDPKNAFEGDAEGGLGESEEQPNEVMNGMKRSQSQHEFATRENSFLVLDWDDTLFPTTWIRTDLELDWKRNLDDQLDDSPEKTEIESRLDLFSERVEAFLREAHSHSQIFIVTLARRPWVDISTKNFMPIFTKLLKELDIKVLYARDVITETMEREYNAAEFRSSEEEVAFWMKAKAKCMELELDSCHRKVEKSWKNVMSFGDSIIERRALGFATREHLAQLGKGGQILAQGLTAEVVTKDGHLQKLRTKTLKMIDDPSVEELTAQITVMTDWMSFITKDTYGLDIELDDSSDDDKLNALNRNITGVEKSDLCWMDLAGM